MADLASKKNPLDLRDEDPDYVKDVSGSEDPTNQPDIGTDPMSLPSEGTKKPVVHLDDEKVRRHDAERDAAQD